MVRDYRYEFLLAGLLIFVAVIPNLTILVAVLVGMHFSSRRGDREAASSR